MKYPVESDGKLIVNTPTFRPLTKEDFDRMDREQGRQRVPASVLEGLTQLALAYQLAICGEKAVELFAERTGAHKSIAAAVRFFRSGVNKMVDKVSARQVNSMDVNTRKVYVSYSTMPVADKYYSIRPRDFRMMGEAALYYCQYGCKKTAGECRHCPLSDCLHDHESLENRIGFVMDSDCEWKSAKIDWEEARKDWGT